MIKNTIFENNINKVYPDVEAKKYLAHYYDKLKEINKFLDNEISKHKNGNDRVFFCQRILEFVIDNNRLINFIEVTKMNFKKILDEEKSKLELSISLIKREIEEEHKIELSAIKTKQERENFIKILSEQNDSIVNMKKNIVYLELSDEAFKVELGNLNRLKETLEEFIRILKKELI